MGFFFFFKSYCCLCQTAFSLLYTFTCKFTTVSSFSLLFLYIFFFHVLFAVLTSCFSSSLPPSFACVRLHFICHLLVLVSLVQSVLFLFYFLCILCFSYFFCSYFLLLFFFISFFCLWQTLFSLPLLESLLQLVLFFLYFLRSLCSCDFCCFYLLLLFFFISFFCLWQTAFSLISTFTCKFLQSLYSLAGFGIRNRTRLLGDFVTPFHHHPPPHTNNKKSDFLGYESWVRIS